VNNTSCDSFGYDSSTIHRVLSQKRQLDKEQSEADQALGAALAKVDRLRRQRQALETKILQMFEQEGEVLREQERQEAAAAPSSAPDLSPGPADVSLE
jgi:phage shock protein A